jgi:hypothetical protein
MEPHREESQKALQASAEQRPKRFRIVKLEERIAPSQGGGHTGVPQCGQYRTAASPCQYSAITCVCW